MKIKRITDYSKRKTDTSIKYYKCIFCGRINPSNNTLMVNNQAECLWACLPLRNHYKGWLLKQKEKRSK